MKFGGLKFLDAAHVKDLLALLRFVENPRYRVAGFRLIHFIQGLAPLQLNGCLTIWSMTRSFCWVARRSGAAPSWRRLDGLFRAVAELRDLNWPADLEPVRLWYEPHLDRIYEDALVRVGQILSNSNNRERLFLPRTVPDRTYA